jgi:predicted Zn-dependent peptidase
MKRFLLLPVLIGFALNALGEGVTLPPERRIELPGGTVLVLVANDEVPLVSFQARVRGGAVADPPGKSGIADLLAGLLTQGAGGRDATAFAETVESVGGEFWAQSGLEGIAVSGEFLARDTALMVELLADVLRRPALDPDEVAKLRTRAINLIRAAKDSDPNVLLPVYANAFVFGAHPYGNPVSGDETSLAAITHQDIVDYYRDQFGGDRLILSVAGDFDPKTLEAELAAALGDWRAAAAPLPAVPEPQPAAGGRVLLVDKPGATQTYFWIGNTGVARDFPERAELDLVNTLFGGRFTSMLNTALRIESGLTYGASSELVQPTKAGTVSISSYTRTDATVEAIDMSVNLLGRLHDTDLGLGMLDSGRSYLLGQFPLELETGAQLAAQFAQLEFYGLDRSYVDAYGDELAAVSADSVRPVIEAVYPSRDDLVYVLLGDADAIRDAVAKYGEVTELPITEPYFRVPPVQERP